MSRIPESNEKGSSPYSRHLKQSSFISQLQMQRKERIASIRPSRKQMSNSTLFDPDEEQTKVNTHSKKHLKEPQAGQQIDDELKRARSLKLISFQKPIPQSGEKKASNELNQNVVKLKVEQMTFKFKTKIGVLLKQIMVPVQQLTKFSALTKIDEMLQFLSQKVKQKVTMQQITEVNIQKQLSRQKNVLNNYEVQIESFKKKLQEKDISQKTLKIKLKDMNNQLRELYDKMNLKQKELSTKVTEIYQLKTTLKENEKILQNLQRKYDGLNEEAKVERTMFTDQSNDIIYSTKNILEENNKLLEKLKELQQQLQVTEQKQRCLTEINTQLNLEVKRWRERFQDGSIVQEEKQKRSLLDSYNQKDFVQVLVVPSNQLRKSTMSLHNQISNMDSVNRRVSLTALEIENLKLSSRVQDLERQNKQLNRDVANYIAMKEHYQKAIAVASQSSTSIRGEDSSKKIQSLKEVPIYLQQISQQEQCQKKIEQVAKEWKDKLYEIVNNYEDQLETIKTKLQQLTKDKQQLEKMLLEKTNQKYEVQKKLVEHQQQIYQLLKTYRNVNGLTLRQQKKDELLRLEDKKGETVGHGSEKQREKGEAD